jgi:uncharacterized membrane protein YjjP (DUF1212 family)|tara:strand:- start:205 stop:408 length:204 start_codon:yes stop_codon:yes gene_type:complete
MKKFYFIVILYFGLISNAQAYLEPGTGSVIISAFFAGIVAIKIYWYLIINKVKSFFNRKNKVDKKNV